ncbi:MAG: hypothetical protein AAGU77_09320 [Bacillota bacterium]
MEANELLARVHEGNEEAFRLLFAQYGEALHQSMMERCHDKRLAREALKDVFQKAYTTLRNSEQPDGTALWLNELAMNSLEERLAAQKQAVAALEESQRGQENAAPETFDREAGGAERIISDVRKGMDTSAACKTPHVSGTAIAIILIVLLLLIIWYIVGALMRMGMLPNVDLGYSWFSSHVFSLF